MARFRDVSWRLPGSDDDATVTNDVVRQALLMDIRDRLDVLRCSEFRDIPSILRQIRTNTARPAFTKSERIAANYQRYRRALMRRRTVA
jgi:hypothetical protein